jgi:hypothetical protein
MRERERERERKSQDQWSYIHPNKQNHNTTANLGSPIQRIFSDSISISLNTPQVVINKLIRFNNSFFLIKHNQQRQTYLHHVTMPSCCCCRTADKSIGREKPLAMAAAATPGTNTPNV